VGSSRSQNAGRAEPWASGGVPSDPLHDTILPWSRGSASSVLLSDSIPDPAQRAARSHHEAGLIAGIVASASQHDRCGDRRINIHRPDNNEWVGWSVRGGGREEKGKGRTLVRPPLVVVSEWYLTSDRCKALVPEHCGALAAEMRRNLGKSRFPRNRSLT
jgi:hypothetical protein